jgi:uncharacterized protein (TIGR04255 family)
MKFNLDQLPKKINPCPITEAIVELRFESKVPREVMVGIIYNKFKTRYPNLSPLPITQLSVDFIESQPNLKYAPYYSLKNNDYTFQIGPRCFSLVCPKEYKSWKSYYNEIKWVFKHVNDLEIIKAPERLGVRYVNFFKGINIFEKIKTDLTLGGNSLIKNVNTLRTEFNIEKFRCIYQISNNSYFLNTDKGSSVDIDLIFEKNIDIANCESLIDDAHGIEKKLFFGVLQEDFLESLNPEYE